MAAEKWPGGNTYFAKKYDKRLILPVCHEMLPTNKKKTRKGWAKNWSNQFLEKETLTAFTHAKKSRDLTHKERKKNEVHNQTTPCFPPIRW